jgi:GcrA cell cycle regulator
MKWTAEMLTTLDRMWIAGEKTSAIGRTLKISPSAVIGKAHRRNLPGRKSPIKGDGPAVQRRREATRFANLVRRRTGQELLPPVPVRRRPPRKVVQAPLKPAKPPPVVRPPPPPPTCSWPLGEPGRIGFRFCGEPSVPGKPYCGDHCKLAYLKRAKRDAA